MWRRGRGWAGGVRIGWGRTARGCVSVGRGSGSWEWGERRTPGEGCEFGDSICGLVRT